jgi:hypothetical protein
MIGATTGLLSASLADEFAKQIYEAGPGVLSVGVTAPMGKAQSVKGGYKVSGRWPFGSGSQNAHWISGGSFIFDGDTQRLGKGGAPELHLMMLSGTRLKLKTPGMFLDYVGQEVTISVLPISLFPKDVPFW